MNNHKTNESTNPKPKSICIRVTDEELRQIDKLSKYNHQTRTAYILNRCIPETSDNINIYNRDFMNTVNKLSDLVNNFKSDVPAVKEEIVSLRREVEKLWLYLK